MNFALQLKLSLTQIQMLCLTAYFYREQAHS